jgi:hypothetical protein
MSMDENTAICDVCGYPVNEEQTHSADGDWLICNSCLRRSPDYVKTYIRGEEQSHEMKVVALEWLRNSHDYGGPMPHFVDASDWVTHDGDITAITASTTDEQIKSLAQEYEMDAIKTCRVVVKGLVERFTEIRDDRKCAAKKGRIPCK